MKPQFVPVILGGSSRLHPSLMLNFLSGSLDPRITFSRGTQAMQYGSNGTLQYAPNNLLTYSNQADNAAWTKSNSFVQQNLLLYSEDFTNANWTKQSITVTADSTVSPFGAFTADTITAAGGVLSIIYQSVGTTVASSPYAQSIYAKAGSKTVIQADFNAAGWGTDLRANFDLANGVLGTVDAGVTATIENLGNGWYRCSAARTKTPTTGNLIWCMVDSATSAREAVCTAGTLYIFGAQLVQGSVRGDYRATTSADLPVLYADYNGALRARKLCEGSAAATQVALYETNTVVVGATYTFSAKAKAGERRYLTLYPQTAGVGGYAIFDLQTGTITATGGTQYVASSMVAAGNGYYFCTVSYISTTTTSTSVFYFTNSSTTPAPAYTGDGSSGIYIADAQLTPGYLPLAVTETTSAAVYGPRFDYDPVTKVARGLLIEEQRTNLLLQSNTFNVTWTASTNTNVTSAATTSPEGVVNAWRLYGSNGLSPGGLIQGISKAAAATQYTWSIYAKAAGYNWIQLAVFDAVADGNRYWFNLSTGVLGSTAVIGAGFTGISATITNIGNGWYRCTLTATSNAGTQFQSYAYPTNGDGVVTAGDAFTDGTFIYGAQLEAGAFATSYIPTLGSTATRNADSASITTLTPWFNAAAGTVYAEYLINSFANSSIAVNFNVSNSGFSVSGVGAARWWNGTSVLATANTLATGAIRKEAFAYTASTRNICLAGGTVATDANVPWPSTPTAVFFGASASSANTQNINGWMRSVRFYPTALSSVSQQSITA